MTTKRNAAAIAKLGDDLRGWLYRLGFDPTVVVCPHRHTVWTAELSSLVMPPCDGWVYWPARVVVFDPSDTNDTARRRTGSHRELLAVFDQRGADATLRWWVKPQPFLDYVRAMRHGVV